MWNAIINRVSHWDAWEHFSTSQRGRESTTEFNAAVEKGEQSENILSRNSDATSDPRKEDWPTEDSFKLASYFSESMSDNLSEKRQSKNLVRQQGT